MIDVSQTGARLLIEGSLEGLDLKEFFLLLSSTGLAYRRCQLVRVDGNQIGVEFLARGKSLKRAKQKSGD
jgi:PilZ domain